MVVGTTERIGKELTMAYVRLTLVQPRAGERDRVEEFLRRLSVLTATQDGCIESYLLHPQPESDEIGRIAIYEDAAAADRAANSDPIMALRSQMDLYVDARSHLERAFTTEDAAAPVLSGAGLTR
jgi:quinol monooxygenase YgiN